MRMVVTKMLIDEDRTYQSYEEIGEALESEMQRVAGSGIELEDWFISDEDDEVEFGRYINYVVQWAFKHAMDESEGDDMLLSFAKWKKGACGL